MGFFKDKHAGTQSSLASEAQAATFIARVESTPGTALFGWKDSELQRRRLGRQLLLTPLYGSRRFRCQDSRYISD